MSRIYFYLNIYKALRLKAEADPEYWKDKLNQAPIWIDYSFGQRLRIPSKIFVNPNDWDKTKQRIKGSDPDSGPKNHRLSVIRGKLISIETEAISNKKRLTIDFIKEKLAPGIDIPSHSNNEKFFTDTWKDFIKDNPDMNQSTRRNYDNTLIVFQDFCNKHDWKLTFDSIDQDFFQELKKYFAVEREITRNTVGKYIKNLKAFMNHCTKKGLNTNLAFKQFEVYKDAKEVTYLTIDELKEIKKLVLESELLQHTRDLFLFSCFSGLRYSDSQKITPANIKEGFIVFTTVKTKKPQYTPLTPQANEILKKYNYQLPKIKLHIYNEKIKEIGKLAKINVPTIRIRFVGSDRIEEKGLKYEFFSSHLAKRTFISIFFRGGGRIDTIMKTTGNKDRKTMKSYLEILDKDVKNETDQIFDNIGI